MKDLAPILCMAWFSAAQSRDSQALPCSLQDRFAAAKMHFEEAKWNSIRVLDVTAAASQANRIEDREGSLPDLCCSAQNRYLQKCQVLWSHMQDVE
jgi:hypothetical protein